MVDVLVQRVESWESGSVGCKSGMPKTKDTYSKINTTVVICMLARTFKMLSRDTSLPPPAENPTF